MAMGFVMRSRVMTCLPNWLWKPVAFDTKPAQNPAGVVASNQTNKAIRETQATVTTAAAGLLAPLNNLHLAL
jgi:hypothetical protein